VRIVSLLPSTTEILFAIGAGDEVVGVTFECDFPAEARTRTIVSTSAMPEALAPAEIDDFVAAAMARGDDLYHLDEGALAGLDADLVVTQDLCAVCAVDVSVVDDALTHLGCTADVLTIDPHTLDDVLESILTLGRATGHESEAERLVAEQRARLDVVRRASRAGRAGPRPRVMFLEWTDAPYAPGHWIPEMVEAAGGEPLLATPGESSRRVTWEAIREAEPEVFVVAPCGFDRDGCARLADDLIASGVLPVGVRVLAVDANASWARPGTRLLDGVEELARLLSPSDVVEVRSVQGV
jgi:iron complex transport system substrate-binding protein